MNGLKLGLGVGLALALLCGPTMADTSWYTDAVIGDGAAMYWSFNSQNASTGYVSEMVGGNAVDAMRPVLKNGSEYTTGWLGASVVSNLGNAFVTNNSTGSVSTYMVYDSSKTTTVASYAIEFWALRSAANAGYLLVAPSGLASQIYTGWAPAGTGGLAYASPDPAVSWGVTSQNAWHHFAITVDSTAGSTTTIVDGGAPVTTSGAMTPLQWQTAMILGSSAYNGESTKWRGAIDELAIYDLTGKSSSEISTLTTELQTHYDLAFAAGAAQLTVTSSGAISSGGAISVSAAASYDAGKIANLTINTASDSLNGGNWTLSGALADGRVKAGAAAKTATATLSGVANLLNGASVNSGSVTMTVAGYDIAGATGGGDFTYTLNGAVSGNVAALGTAQTANVALGESLADLSSTTAREGDALGNTAAIVAGVATTAGQVSETWRARTANDVSQTVASDVVSLATPTGSDGFLLAMSYNESDVAVENKLALGWLNGTAWVNAVTGNSATGSKAITGYVGSLESLLADLSESDLPDYIGSWGVDTDANTVWAVLNHNSDFSVISVPEPGAFTLFAAGVISLLAYAWRKRK